MCPTTLSQYHKSSSIKTRLKNLCEAMRNKNKCKKKKKKNTVLEKTAAHAGEMQLSFYSGMTNFHNKSVFSDSLAHI